MRVSVLIAILGAVVLVGCKPGAPKLGPVTTMPAPSAKVLVALAAKADPLAHQFAADPVAFLQSGLTWYSANVKDYTCTLSKLERMNPSAGDFLPEQILQCKFKENPYSVFTHTVKNPRGAEKALYVEGKWNNKMKARTGGFLPLTVEAEPRGSLARQNTLRFLDQFGFKRSLDTIQNSLKTALAEKIVRVEVLGPDKVGDRDMLVFESWIREAKPTGRFEYPHVRVYLDRQWRLPLGVDIYDANNIERGRYRLTDIKFNVGLKDDDFTLKANGM